MLNFSKAFRKGCLGFVYLVGAYARGQPPDDLEPSIGYEVREIQHDHDSMINGPVDGKLFPHANTSKIQDSTVAETNNAEEEVLNHEDDGDVVVISSPRTVSVPPATPEENGEEEEIDYEDGRDDQANELTEGERSAQYSSPGFIPVIQPRQGFPPWLFPGRPHHQPILHHIEHAIVNPSDEEDYPLNIPLPPPVPPYLQPYDETVFKPYPFLP